jgi:hypothetical protein
MSETKWVPLVSWETGTREVVGEAEVMIDDDGREYPTGAVKSDKIKVNVNDLSIDLKVPEVPVFDPPAISMDEILEIFGQ